MHRIQDLLILVRARYGQNTRMRACDIVRLGPQTARHDHAAIFAQRLANRVQTFGLGAVEKAAGVHNYRIGTAIIGADPIAFGAQSGQDPLTIHKRLGAAKRDHPDFGLTLADRLLNARTGKIWAKIWWVLCHIPRYSVAFGHREARKHSGTIGAGPHPA